MFDAPRVVRFTRQQTQPVRTNSIFPFVESECDVRAAEKLPPDCHDTADINVPARNFRRGVARTPFTMIYSELNARIQSETKPETEEHTKSTITIVTSGGPNSSPQLLIAIHEQAFQTFTSSLTFLDYLNYF